MQGCVAGRCAHLAEQCFHVAAAVAWVEERHNGWEPDTRRNPAARKVGDQNGGAVSLFSSGPTKARLLVGDEVDEALQASFCRRLRRGGTSGGSTRGSNDGLLADAGWRRMCERRGGRLTADGLTGAEAGEAADEKDGVAAGLDGRVGAEIVGIGGRMSEPYVGNEPMGAAGAEE